MRYLQGSKENVSICSGVTSKTTPGPVRINNFVKGKKIIQVSGEKRENLSP